MVHIVYVSTLASLCTCQLSASPLPLLFLLSLLDPITWHESVIHQNPSSILSFIVDILQIFSIDLPYSISPWYKDLIQPTTTTRRPTHWWEDIEVGARLRVGKTSQSITATEEVKSRLWVMDSSAHSQRSRLEKANGIGMACQVACLPSNDSLKNKSIKTHRYTRLGVDIACRVACHPAGGWITLSKRFKYYLMREHISRNLISWLVWLAK